jgi:hypothetical protein
MSKPEHADDPHDEWPVILRWEHVKDNRSRKTHSTFPRRDDEFWDLNPPRWLGRFNCRGDYVVKNEQS